MKKREAQELLNRYVDGTCTPEEKALIDHWYLMESSRQKLPDENEDPFSEKSEIWQAISEINHLQGARGRVRKIILKTSIAASLIFMLGAGAYFYTQQKTEQLVKIDKTPTQNNDIDPGGNKAVLTLADGSKILLDNTGQGHIATQSGIQISKSSDGSITYQISQKEAVKQSKSIVYNTIETPKGGKYHIILPDGSNIWLNAASSLRFPAAFTGKERSVELKGEAYFEIAKNKNIPFRVHTDDINILVTGTQFNVMAYKDENYSTTTLVEGSVEVRNSSQNISLVPGEQAINKTGNSLSKKEVDIEGAIAWKNGLFRFNNSDIQYVMRQISRWYDVSVEYQGKIPHNHFGGYISRDSKLSQVIKMLELSGVKFSVEDKKIIILP